MTTKATADSPNVVGGVNVDFGLSSACFICGKQDNLTGCEKCHVTHYCSEECKQKDAEGHESRCVFYQQQIHSLKEKEAAEKRRLLCPVCGEKGTKRCSRCKSTLYCSSEHQREDWKRHKRQCRAPTAAESVVSGAKSKTEEGEKGAFDIKSVLPPDVCVTEDNFRKVKTWEEYGELRGMSIDDTKTTFLSTMMSLYNCIANIFDLYPKKKKVYVHYLGPTQTLELKPLGIALLQEVVRLLPGLHLEITMVGPAVAEDMHETFTEGGLDNESFIKASFYRGLYHDYVKEQGKEYEKPDFVFLPNAQISAFLTWLPTITLVNKLDLRMFFSAYRQDAIMADVNAQYQCGYRRSRFIPADNPFGSVGSDTSPRAGVNAYYCIG